MQERLLGAVVLERVTETAASIVDNLPQFYTHDTSQFRRSTPEADGRFHRDNRYVSYYDDLDRCASLSLSVRACRFRPRARVDRSPSGDERSLRRAKYARIGHCPRRDAYAASPSRRVGNRFSGGETREPSICGARSLPTSLAARGWKIGGRSPQKPYIPDDVRVTLDSSGI